MCVRKDAQRLAEEQDRPSVDLLLAVVSGTTDAMFVKDRDGKYLLFNEAASRFVGKPVAEVLGRDDTALFDAESAKVVMARDRRVMASGVTETEEEDVVTIDGVRRTYLATKLPYRDRDGNVLGVIGISRDITERRELEQQLRAERDRFQTTVDTAPVVICSFQQRLDGTYCFPCVSRRIEDVYGLSAERLAVDATPLFNIVHPEDARHFRNAIEASARDLTTWKSEFRVRHSSRGEVWVEGQAAPVRQPDGSILWHGYIADVTDRKQAERARARLAAIVDSTVDVIISKTPDGVIQTWNPGAERLFGYTSAEMVGKSIRSIIPTDRQAEEDRILASILTGDGLDQMDTVRLTKDGRRVDVSITVSPIRDTNGRILGTSEIARDLGDRKRTVEALRESERLLSIVTGAARVGLVVVNERYEYLFANEAYADVLGLPLVQIRGRRVPELLPDGWAQIRPRLDRALAGETVTYELTLPPLSGGSSPRYFRVMYEPRPDPQGRPTVIVVVSDVTEPRLAEIEARTSRAKLAAALDSMSDAVLTCDTTGRLVEFNQAVVKFHRFRSRDELLPALADYSAVFDVSFSDGSPAPLETWAVSRALHGEMVTEAEFHLRRKDTGESWVGSYNSAPIRGADGDIVGAVLVGRDITDRRQAEKQLRDSEDRFRTLVEFLPDAVFLNVKGRVAYCNRSCLRLFGAKEAAQIVGMSPFDLFHPDDHGAIRRRITHMDATGEPAPPLCEQVVRFDGAITPVSVAAIPIRDAEQPAYLVVLRDLTEQRRMEAQFRQAQKMEAIGRLAGGVAHDFNNLLTVINGYTDLLLGQTQAEHPFRAALTAVRDAGERASALTSQLLAFSRKAIVAPKVVDLNEIITHAEKLLRRLIGEDIALVAVLDHTACRIEADPNQLDQVILNLAVNSRDAMPTGGKLTIETRRTELTAFYQVESGEVSPGCYVELVVRDTGGGMTDDVKARLFEPFFTTKDTGKGTGLGLAVVHGIVKQAGGHISVESEVGAGTAFRILFPEAADPAPKDGSGSISPARRGTEAVLLVEDDDGVRKFSRLALESKGYRVLAVSCGKEAIQAIASKDAQIDLLVTDVVMPGMSGREVADAARAMVPGLRVLYVSGYTDDAILRHGVREATDAFLQKPFSALALARKVRAVLDGHH